jgi:precorrin-6A/cobalt-precorrin-6A reductase
MRILILGGTLEARQLAARLAGRRELAVTLSLAGRTRHPAALPVPVRIGGFGGVAGLAAYLQANRIDLLVDATHPYAARISANAARAANQINVPLMAVRRPPWRPVAGDRWTEADNVETAARRLGDIARRVFLALGRQELAVFEAAPQHHYLIRSVDPVEPPLGVPHAVYLLGRGPFDEAHDRALLTEHRIEIIVAKNSGGQATYGKIAAARALGIEVMLLRRPALPEVPAVASVDAATAEIDHALTRAAERGV